MNNKKSFSSIDFYKFSKTDNIIGFTKLVKVDATKGLFILRIPLIDYTFYFLGTPQIIEELRGKEIVKIGVGKNLSVFLTAKGQVLTCGIQDLTALSETECKLNRPCPVQGLDDIVDISVGAEHVLVLNKKGQVYGWGNNFSSQLGLDPDVHGDLVTKPILIPGDCFLLFSRLT